MPRHIMANLSSPSSFWLIHWVSSSLPFSFIPFLSPSFLPFSFLPLSLPSLFCSSLIPYLSPSHPSSFPVYLILFLSRQLPFSTVSFILSFLPSSPLSSPLTSFLLLGEMALLTHSYKCKDSSCIIRMPFNILRHIMPNLFSLGWLFPVLVVYGEMIPMELVVSIASMSSASFSYPASR